jgi:surface polysaccharide O-acyltransferase-like enzyme
MSGWVANIERLRIAAIIGIVWFHTQGAPGRRIAYAGLPVFLFIFYSLIVRQGCAGNRREFLRQRWGRLMKPWLFWSVVYAVCKILNGVRMGDGQPLHELLTPGTLLIGAHIHLWYLPYAFVTGLILYLSDRWISRIHQMAVIWGSIGVGLLLLVVFQGCVHFQQLPMPLAQWAFALATLPLGLAIGRCCRLPTTDSQRTHLLAAGFIVLLSCLLLSLRGYHALCVPYGLAFPAVCAAYAWPGRRDSVTGRLASLCYGIYLLHPLIAYIMFKFLLSDGHLALVIFLTLCISALITWIMRQTPARSFV